jgi:hypothetical protein
MDNGAAPPGRVAIANSDAAGDAYIHLAIDQAGRGAGACGLNTRTGARLGMLLRHDRP